LINSKSKGSVVTRVVYGGIFNYHFITNLLMIMAAKEL